MLLTKFKDFIWLVIGSLILLTAVFFVAKYFGSKQYKSDNSKFIFETSIRYVDKPIKIPKIKAKTDTVWVVQFLGNSNDSAYVPIQIAYADTLLKQDSSSVKITYYYPPKNYFDLNLNIKEKIITHEITKILPYEPKFWDRFNVVIYGGFGYDFLQRVPTVSVGLGLGIDIKKIF